VQFDAQHTLGDTVSLVVAMHSSPRHSKAFEQGEPSDLRASQSGLAPVQ
jgi:hypothetical protein